MTGIVIANFPIIALIVAGHDRGAVVDHLQAPAQPPGTLEARAYFRAKAAAEPHASDFVPTTRVAAFDGLTVARRHLAARAVVPGRRRATAGPAVRTHPPGTPRPGQPGPRPPGHGRHGRHPVTPGAGGNHRMTPATRRESANSRRAAR